jgi:predicted Zn-dependent protease with MMP-like domain
VTRSELGERAEAIYVEKLRHLVETEENIGKMLIIEVESRDYDIDELGIESAHKLQARYPGAPLFGIRIGYKVAASFDGGLERCE